MVPSRKARRLSAATRLRDFRDRQGGISQAKAAAMCSVPTRTWEGWERAGKAPPACMWRLIDYIDRFGPLPPTEQIADMPRE